jgi:pimeloyl-ACP methyl ester carboxylesterase
MRLRQIDLLGHRFGALVAAELAAARPAQVRHLALVSPPLAADTPEPQPATAAADGSHLLEEWRRAVAHAAPDTSPEAVTAVLAERLRNGARAMAAAAAAQRGYPLRARLAQISVPLLVLRLHDDVAASKGPPRDVPARTRLIELPDRCASLFETAPEIAAQALESFLR